MDYLVVRAGCVIDCVTSDSRDRVAAQFDGCTVVERTSVVGPGWLYADGVFTAPTPPPAAPVDRRISNYAFIRRFADPEAVAIDLASQGATPQAAMMRRKRDLADRAPSVDLDGHEAYLGTHALEKAGLLAAGRADEILSAPVRPSERPDGSN